MKLKIELKSEGEAALHGSLGLREIERAAVAGNKWAISLGKQIANVNQGLHPVRKELSIMDGLPQINCQVAVRNGVVIGSYFGQAFGGLPAIGRPPSSACSIDLAAHAYCVCLRSLGTNGLQRLVKTYLLGHFCHFKRLAVRRCK